MRFLLVPFITLIFCAGALIYMRSNNIAIEGLPGPITGLAVVFVISLIYAVFHFFDEKRHKNKD